MKSLSPDLAKKIAAQEQKLSILQEMVKANEGQWAAQKKQIADDTRTTIDLSKKALANATVEAKTNLDKLWEQIKEARDTLAETQKEKKARIIELDQSITDLEHSHKVLAHTNATLQDSNRALDSEIVVRQENADALKVTEENLSVDIASLQSQQEQLEVQLAKLRAEFKDTSDAFAQLKDEVAAKTDQFNADILLLEQKKQDIAQEIIQNRTEDNAIRENLASWSKKLEERDKNLRTREAKVNEQEKSIARNYNLL